MFKVKTVHLKAPSGSGKTAFCGKDEPTDIISDNILEITCETCIKEMKDAITSSSAKN
jgi:hypothetical protein